MAVSLTQRQNSQATSIQRLGHSVIGAMFVSEERTSFSFTHVLESHRFVRSEAKTLLALGLGTGAALSALQKYTSLRVDAVEIDPTVAGFAEKYFGFDANVGAALT